MAGRALLRMISIPSLRFVFFFFNDTATTEIYTLSLHDALPISADEEEARESPTSLPRPEEREIDPGRYHGHVVGDRKSTRLNSSHLVISYAVFCLKKITISLYRMFDLRDRCSRNASLNIPRPLV